VVRVLFMFVIGMELDFGVVARNLRKSILISSVGIALPFALGAGVAALLSESYPAPNASYTGFLTFCGTAMSITAFPVLARVLSENQLLGTAVGSTTMNAAAVRA
jgi:Kef-type K+ transport system membrane component KefB